MKELKEYRLDVPQVTELAYELKKEGVELPDGILTIEELTDALVPLLKGQQADRENGIPTGGQKEDVNQS